MVTDDGRALRRAALDLLRTAWPPAASAVGGLVLLAGALQFPHDSAVLREDTAVREEGTAVPATISRVDTERHTGRRSGWTEYTPVVAFRLDGRDRTVELPAYTVRDEPGTYVAGEHVTVVVDDRATPGRPAASDLALATPGSRGRVEGAVRDDVVAATLGAVATAAGVVALLVRRRRRRAAR